MLLLALPAAAAVPTFLELPTNQTVVEGGNATFSCNATVNGARQPLSYEIGNGAGDGLQSVGANITDLSLVDGVVGACVFGEFRTQLILKGVTRQADGYTVTCSVLYGPFFVAPQNEPPAFLSVICASTDLHFVLYQFGLATCQCVFVIMQTHQHTASSIISPALCWMEKTSPSPLNSLPTQLPPISPGPEMARSSPVVVG